MTNAVIERSELTETLLRSRFVKQVLIGLVYGVIMFFSIWVAYQLRFDFFVSASPSDLVYRNTILNVALWVVPTKLVVFSLFRQYQGLLSYFGTPDLYRLVKAIAVCSAVLGIVRLQYDSLYVPPRGVLLLDFIMSIGLLTVFRVACRVARETFSQEPSENQRSEAARIGIIGAGDVGANLAKDLLNRRGLRRLPVVFFDDDSSKHGTRIHNIKVEGPPEVIENVRQGYNIDEVVIAMPGAPARRMGEVIRLLQKHHINFVTVPSLDQMTTGKVRVSRLRPIEIQDLLGRDPVAIERNEIEQLVRGKVILVTGAGGSIGSELCRQVASFNPQRLLMLDHSEFHLFEIEQELIQMGYGGIQLALIGSILDESRMARVLQRYQPGVIFHAAALKHVPMVEAQPLEAIKVNTFGTALLARLAKKYHVGKFVMISTDKAINPTSVMGATKRLAEIYLQSFYANDPEHSPDIMAVRFGNVLGSSGSVVPLFKQQIAMGGPVKVTHQDVTRYFMTIPEAVGLVLQSATQGRGGDIFVLDMGDPVKIVDLARQMIELSGFRAEEDIELEFTGLRPGEKLFEELQHEGENVEETNYPKVRRFVCEAQPLERVESIYRQLEEEVEKNEVSNIKTILQIGVPEYSPFHNEGYLR